MLTQIVACYSVLFPVFTFYQRMITLGENRFNVLGVNASGQVRFLLASYILHPIELNHLGPTNVWRIQPNRPRHPQRRLHQVLAPGQGIMAARLLRRIQHRWAFLLSRSGPLLGGGGFALLGQSLPLPLSLLPLSRTRAMANAANRRLVTWSGTTPPL